jgi:hypothetical protein
MSPDPTSVALLRSMLAQILSEDAPAGRLRQIKAFQTEVWSESDTLVSPQLDELLRDLAYDLDFYEPHAARRAEDRAFIGDDDLESLVRAGLTSPAWPDVNM